MSEKVLWVFYDSIAKIQSNPLTTNEAQSTILKIRPQSVDRFFIWTQGWQNWQPLRTYLESDQKNFVSTFTVSRSNEETMRAVAREILENTHTNTLTHTMTQTSIPGSKEDTNTQTKTGTKSKLYSSIHLAEETISRYMRIDNEPDSSFYKAHFDGDELTLTGIQKPNLDFSKILSKTMDNRSPRHELKIEVLLISQRGKTFRSRSKNISLSGILLEDTMPFEFYDNIFDLVVISNLTKDPRKARVKLQGKAIVPSGNRSQRIQYEAATEEQKTNLQALLEDYVDAAKNKKTA